MSVRLQQEDFDISKEMDMLIDGRTSVGAAVSFIGLVRDMVKDARILDMTLEHYPAMAQAELERIEQEAKERWPMIDGTLIIHRYGKLMPGERIVLVIVLSSHRQASFEAAEFMMDFLKTRAPFWKKERLEDGETGWVEAKDKDDTALERWHKM